MNSDILFLKFMDFLKYIALFMIYIFFYFPGNTTNFEHHILHEHWADPVSTNKELQPCQPKIQKNFCIDKHIYCKYCKTFM